MSYGTHPSIDRHSMSSPPSSKSAKGPNQKSVLIVDDEPAIVDMLAFLFEDEGYRVLRAYDGEEALRIAELERPALVISDISLPRLNGIELVRRLHLRADYELPAILMSAAVRDLPGDPIPFVPKPFDPESMLSLANRCLCEE
jgi:CheY-like chemotaxis protein